VSGIAMRFSLAAPPTGWSVKTLFPNRTAIFKAAAARSEVLAAEGSGPFLNDPARSTFRESFKAGYDADKLTLSLVNIAAKRGKKYGQFVRLAEKFDPARELHLPVVGKKVRDVIFPEIQGALQQDGVRTARKAFSRHKR
jgi:hypothetical protein